MDENSLDDLKKFITLAISEQISDVRADIKEVKSDIKELDEKLSTKIDAFSQSVAEAIDSSSDSADTQLKNHEQRITTVLKHKAV